MTMTRVTHVLALAAAVLCVPAGGWTARADDGQAGNDPIRVGRGQVQLFVDDFLIAEQEGLRRTLHQPAKDDGGRFPVIAPQEPDDTLLPQGSIIRDLKLGRHVMFAFDRKWEKVYRFTSADAMNWIHGDHGQPEPLDIELPYPGPLPERSGFGLLPYYDARNGEHPYHGWLYGANWGNEREGIYYVYSRDGRKWKCGRMVMNAFAGLGDPSSHLIRQDGRTLYGPGDATGFSYDSLEDRFLVCIKYFNPEPVPPGNQLRSRAYAYIDRLDEPFDVSKLVQRVDQVPPAAAKDGDRPFDEYYSSMGWRAGTLWLGLLDVWHRREDYPWSAAGCMFKKLISSRDGLHWRKVQFANDDGVPEVFIPNGPQGGNGGRNDGGYLYNFEGPPLRIGDEYVFYYGGSSYGKNPPDREKRITGGGIFRARLRVDGYVSVNGGSLTTRPLRFEGGELLVNGAGPMVVEVRGLDGTLLGSSRIEGDSIRHKVRFAGRPLARVVPENCARLRFQVTPPGALYAFTIE